MLELLLFGLWTLICTAAGAAGGAWLTYRKQQVIPGSPLPRFDAKEVFQMLAGRPAPGADEDEPRDENKPPLDWKLGTAPRVKDVEDV